MRCICAQSYRTVQYLHKHMLHLRGCHHWPYHWERSDCCLASRWQVPNRCSVYEPPLGLPVNIMGYLWTLWATCEHYGQPVNIMGYLWTLWATCEHCGLPVNTTGYLWTLWATCEHYGLPVNTMGYLWTLWATCEHYGLPVNIMG